MLKLENLSSLVKKRKRVGRGGNRGGTSGKGNKGQKARSGPKIGICFEGGQMPLVRRLPKRGFNNKRFQKPVKIVGLQQLDEFFSAGSLVNKESLIEKGIIKGNALYTIKILGTGALSKKLVIHADAFSKSAIQAIEKLGGEVHIVKES